MQPRLLLGFVFAILCLTLVAEDVCIESADTSFGYRHNKLTEDFLRGFPEELPPTRVRTMNDTQPMKFSTMGYSPFQVIFGFSEDWCTPVVGLLKEAHSILLSKVPQMASETLDSLRMIGRDTMAVMRSEQMKQKIEQATKTFIKAAKIFLDPWFGYASQLFQATQGMLLPAADTVWVWLQNGFGVLWTFASSVIRKF